ncbi:integrin alpha-PS3-like [Drosophila ficusphila]|uniref:integrin alpha-PS3-like n=1 Tax=Drosophila ficusphila TaxID=30025 RepID=UPI0007E686C6|nr:integrin alpha-PS3-like [Drosophila ficusphila]
MCALLFLVFLILQYQSDAFNISPHANLVINSPKHLKTHLKLTRSSYFGFSLVIRPSSVIVGAPRAHSSLESQRNIHEPGAIYRCSLESGACAPYDLDSRGNCNSSSNSSTTFDRERKDYQWLGGSLDGGTRDEDRLLACAPRFKSVSAKDYQLNGVCYWVQNTLGKTPEQVTRISPLRTKLVQVIKGRFFYMLGELGLSAHVADDNTRFLIGAPGLDNWKGSVILDVPEENLNENNPIKYVDSKESNLDQNTTKVLNSGNWTQEEDSYFGFAVSSGYFDSSDRSKLFYVATAPRSNEHSGKAFIFDVLGDIMAELHVFNGTQIGEYFGYSVLAEDLNGDGKTDLIVSAPQHALQDSHDDGAIYVFFNRGSFDFERQIILSPAGKRGRFGTTLSRLGDINLDGYNDVAVGAPFAGNGSVFIYLGSKQGLRKQPSQRLDSPSQMNSQYGEPMFGHGLSRGVDVDGNGYNDFVIGAPNAETACLYRAYPVVRVHASVKSESPAIQLEQKKVRIRACYRLETKSKTREVQAQELNIRIVVDTQLKRVEFVENQKNAMSFRPTVGLNESCRDFDIRLRPAVHVFAPIDLEIHYELTKKVPDSENFCKTCAIVDPTDPKVSRDKIIINTDCEHAVCVSDMRLRSNNVSSSFILSSARTLSLNYEITNNGETAYLPQFNVTSTSRLAFAQVPGNCKVAEAVMVCDLNRGRPLAKGDSDYVTISFDVSQLSGESLIIYAEVFSTGNESNPTDNKQTNVIMLRKFTEIDISDGQANARIISDKHPYSTEILNRYEIKARDHVIEKLVVSLYVPIAYKTSDSEKVIRIVNTTSLKLNARCNSHLLSFKLNDQYSRLLTRNPTSVLTQNNSHLPTKNIIRLDCQDSSRTICIRADMQVQLKQEKPVTLNVSFNLDLSAVKDSWEHFVIQTRMELFEEGQSTSNTLLINQQIEPIVISKRGILPMWVIILSGIGGLLLLSVITYALYKSGFFKRDKVKEVVNDVQFQAEQKDL